MSVLLIGLSLSLQVVYTTHSPELVDVEYLSSIGVVKKSIKNGEYYTEVLQIKEDNFKDRWVASTGVEDATIDSIKLFFKKSFRRRNK